MIVASFTSEFALCTPNLQKLLKMTSLHNKIKRCFKRCRIPKTKSMEELCIQKPRIKEIEKRRATVHDIPSSLIEFTKEDKKIVEYTLIWTYLEENLM